MGWGGVEWAGVGWGGVGLGGWGGVVVGDGNGGWVGLGWGGVELWDGVGRGGVGWGGVGWMGWGGVGWGGLGWGGVGWAWGWAGLVVKLEPMPTHPHKPSHFPPAHSGFTLTSLRDHLQFVSVSLRTQFDFGYQLLIK